MKAKKMRFFEFTGAPMNTRGDFGVPVIGGRSWGENPNIFVNDPDFGKTIVGHVTDDDWEEITEDEWRKI